MAANGSEPRGSSKTQTARPNELRIAVMMSGGVSLAVWMGGVAHELDRLRRGEDLYGELTELAQVDPVIDLITGTSAGGLNGTLLAAAVAWGSTLDPLQNLWLRKGDFSDLLRPLSDKSPPSLLQGDQYFLRMVNDALTTMCNAAGSDGIERETGETNLPPLHLTVTTTLMHPFNHVDKDALGEQMSLSTHLGLFRFTKSDETNGFGDPNDSASCQRSIAQLARAARSSASFPVAFEPSFVSIGAVDTHGTDMKGVADFGESRFVMDGGLMDNEPIDQLLDLIAEQPATDKPIRRVLLYVEPLSGPTASDIPPEIEKNLPPLKDVLIDTITVPRQQSTAGQIDQLTQRAEQHNLIQATRANLFSDLSSASVEGLQATARKLRTVVQEMRSTSTEARWRLVTAADPRLTQARQNVLTVLDLLRRAAIAGLDAEGDTRAQLSRALESLQFTASANRNLPENDRTSATDSVVAAVDAAIVSAMGRLAELAELAKGLPEDTERMQLFLEIKGIEALAADPPSTGPPAEPDTDGKAAALSSTFEALTDLDMLQSVVTDGMSHNPQEVELIEVSSYSPTPFGSASTRLTGVQMMHFGAFYQSAWRQNDWIWGRLNGSHQLISMLLDPTSLLRILTPEQIVEKISGLLQHFEDEERKGFRVQALGLLKAVKECNYSEASVESARDCLSKFVSREMGYNLLPSELGRLRSELRFDENIGAFLTDADRNFLDQELPEHPTPAQLEEDWGSCQVGSDTILQQAESERFAEVATQAGGVVAGIFATQKIPLLDHVARFLRPALRFAHFLTTPQAATRTSRFAIGVVLLATSFLALTCGASNVASVYAWVSGLVWGFAAAYAVLCLRHFFATTMAVLFLGFTVGLGIASRHWNESLLIILGAGAAVIATFFGVFAVERDRRKPNRPVRPVRLRRSTQPR